MLSCYPDMTVGLLLKTIWEVIHRNCWKKAGTFQKIFGKHLDKPSVPLSLTLTNHINKPCIEVEEHYQQSQYVNQTAEAGRRRLKTSFPLRILKKYSSSDITDAVAASIFRSCRCCFQTNIHFSGGRHT